MSTSAIGGSRPGGASGSSGTKKNSDCVRPGRFEVRARLACRIERVDQAGLADIGAAGEGDLRRPLARKRRDRRHFGRPAARDGGRAGRIFRPRPLSAPVPLDELGRGAKGKAGVDVFEFKRDAEGSYFDGLVEAVEFLVQSMPARWCATKGSLAVHSALPTGYDPCCRSPCTRQACQSYRDRASMEKALPQPCGPLPPHTIDHPSSPHSTPASGRRRPSVVRTAVSAVNPRHGLPRS